MRETQSSHFWVGHFPEEIAGEYFVEIWDDEDEDREHTPLSAFARDQGVMWYDHDFLEYGWGNSTSIEELVSEYSYSDQWAAELARRVTEKNLTHVNFFVFIDEGEMEQPRSVKTDRYWLEYMGTIEYRI